MNLGFDLPPEKMAKAQTLFIMSLQHICIQKCVADYKNADLSPGELICTDRCVQKYYTANDHLSKLFQAEPIPPTT